jgi:hypothetical protein
VEKHLARIFLLKPIFHEQCSPGRRARSAYLAT